MKSMLYCMYQNYCNHSHSH